MERKEAIKVVRNIYQTDSEKEALETLIPELRESEDERMMRRIIDGFKNFSRSASKWNNIPIEEVIAYLEKKKESLHTTETCSADFFTDEDEIYRKWILEYLYDGLWKSDEQFKGQFKSAIDWFEKQKEQKPAEWSEEDEEMIKMILGDLEWERRNTTVDKDIRHYDKEIAFLKSLRPQPKAELTLLDKNIIEAAVAFVKQNDHFNYWGGIDKHTVIKALHSLKPHWKPSEEQMKVLYGILVGCRGTWGKDTVTTMESLYQDLKKLM